MPARPAKTTSQSKPSFWEFDPLKKIISGALFFLGALAGVALLLPSLVSGLGAVEEWVIPGVLLLIGLLVLLQLARRKNGFVLVLLGLALVGGFAGWGLRAWMDQQRAQKLIVLVPAFEGQEEKYNFRDVILKETRAAAEGLPDVEIITASEVVTRDQGSFYARQLAEKYNADLVVWAWYDDSLAPRLNMFIEDTSPAVLDMPQNSDPSAPQPVIAFLRSFSMRRNFTASSDTFITLMSAMLNYKAGNYQAYLDQTDTLLANKDGSMLLVAHDLNFYRGVTHTVRGETDLAIEAYNQALIANRKGAVSFNNRALAYIDQKEYGLAIKDCELALVIDPQYMLALNTRGMAHLGLQEYDLAIKNFAAAIALEPNDPRLYHNRALAYQAAGKTDFAAADLKKEAELRSAK